MVGTHSFIHLFIHSTHLLSTYYVAGTVLGTGEISVIKTDDSPHSCRGDILGRETDIKQVNKIGRTSDHSKCYGQVKQGGSSEWRAVTC